jgi:hypothetical protein
MVAGQRDLGLDPELRLAVRGLDVDVESLLLAREEEEPKRAVANTVGLTSSDDARPPGRAKPRRCPCAGARASPSLAQAGMRILWSLVVPKEVVMQAAGAADPPLQGRQAPRGRDGSMGLVSCNHGSSSAVSYRSAGCSASCVVPPEDGRAPRPGSGLSRTTPLWQPACGAALRPISCATPTPSRCPTRGSH